VNEISKDRLWRIGCITAYIGYRNGRDDIEYLLEPGLKTEFADLVYKFPELKTMYPKKIIPYLKKHDHATTDRKPNTNKSMNTTQNG